MRFLFVLLVFLLASYANAQQNLDPDKFLGDLVEDIRDNSQDEEINVQRIEDLVGLYDNPFNVNGSNRSDWEKLVFLSVFQIDRIMEFLDRNKFLSSPYQLQGVKGLDVNTIKKINLFVEFKPVVIKSAFSHQGITGKYILRDMFTLEQARGYSSDSSINGYVSNHYKKDLYNK